MWLVVSLAAALASTAAFLKMKKTREKFKLDFLSLMLWGTFIMVLVDHSIAFIEEGRFIEFTTDGLIESGTMLGIAMIIPLLAIWAIALLLRGDLGAPGLGRHV